MDIMPSSRRREDYEPTGQPLEDAADAVSACIRSTTNTRRAFRGAEVIIESLRAEQEHRGSIRNRAYLAKILRRLAAWIDKHPPLVRK